MLTGGACYQVRPDHVQRAVYVISGEVQVAGQPQTFSEAEWIFLKPGADIVLQAPAFHSARLILMGGEPFAESRHIYWNFVSSSAERIEQAKADWRNGRFALVPREHEFVSLPKDEPLKR